MSRHEPPGCWPVIRLLLGMCAAAWAIVYIYQHAKEYL